MDLIQQRGDKDPLDFLSEVISSTNHYPAELKVQAANYLTPYLHSKRSVAAPAPRYIDQPVKVPDFSSIDEAENFLASLPALLGKGELDSQSALELSTLTRAWISARHEREELQLKLQHAGGGPEQRILIEGGLPGLPGCDVIMPHLNGVSGQDAPLNGQTLDLEKNSGLIDHDKRFWIACTATASPGHKPMSVYAPAKMTYVRLTGVWLGGGPAKNTHQRPRQGS